MFERIPSTVDRALHGARAGTSEFVLSDTALAEVSTTIIVCRPEVENVGCLATRFTADGLGFRRRLSGAVCLLMRHPSYCSSKTRTA